MKKYAVIALFLLGAFEVVFPYVADLFSDAFYEDFRTGYLRLGLKTQAQEVFFEDMYAFVRWKLEVIPLFGILTIAIGLLILLFDWIDRRRKHNAQQARSSGPGVGAPVGNRGSAAPGR